MAVVAALHQQQRAARAVAPDDGRDGEADRRRVGGVVRRTPRTLSPTGWREGSMSHPCDDPPVDSGVGPTERAAPRGDPRARRSPASSSGTAPSGPPRPSPGCRAPRAATSVPWRSSTNAATSQKLLPRTAARDGASPARQHAHEGLAAIRLREHGARVRGARAATSGAGRPRPRCRGSPAGAAARR